MGYFAGTAEGEPGEKAKIAAKAVRRIYVPKEINLVPHQWTNEEKTALLPNSMPQEIRTKNQLFSLLEHFENCITRLVYQIEEAYHRDPPLNDRQLNVDFTLDVVVPAIWHVVEQYESGLKDAIAVAYFSVLAGGKKINTQMYSAWVKKLKNTDAGLYVQKLMENQWTMVSAISIQFSEEWAKRYHLPFSVLKERFTNAYLILHVSLKELKKWPDFHFTNHKASKQHLHRFDAWSKTWMQCLKTWCGNGYRPTQVEMLSSYAFPAMTEALQGGTTDTVNVIAHGWKRKGRIPRIKLIGTNPTPEGPGGAPAGRIGALTTQDLETIAEFLSFDTDNDNNSDSDSNSPEGNPDAGEEEVTQPAIENREAEKDVDEGDDVEDEAVEDMEEVEENAEKENRDPEEEAEKENGALEEHTDVDLEDNNDDDPDDNKDEEDGSGEEEAGEAEAVEDVEEGREDTEEELQDPAEEDAADAEEDDDEAEEEEEEEIEEEEETDEEESEERCRKRVFYTTEIVAESRAAEFEEHKDFVWLLSYQRPRLVLPSDWIRRKEEQKQAAEKGEMVIYPKWKGSKIVYIFPDGVHLPVERLTTVTSSVNQHLPVFLHADDLIPVSRKRKATQLPKGKLKKAEPKKQRVGPAPDLLNPKLKAWQDVPRGTAYLQCPTCDHAIAISEEVLSKANKKEGIDVPTDALGRRPIDNRDEHRSLRQLGHWKKMRKHALGCVLERIISVDAAVSQRHESDPNYIENLLPPLYRQIKRKHDPSLTRTSDGKINHKFYREVSQKKRAALAVERYIKDQENRAAGRGLI